MTHITRRNREKKPIQTIDLKRKNRKNANKKIERKEEEEGEEMVR